MNDAAGFSLSGHYRVQSRRVALHSELRGTWITGPNLLDSGIVNVALAQHPSWRGRARTNLKAARVTHRAGTFALEPDILYKRQFFQGAGMDCDIVDVDKSKHEWASRRAALTAIFTPTDLAAIVVRLGDLDAVIANEYYVHEAGHFVGLDVHDKYGRGYFTVQGRTLWPLIYAEELRADLGSFDFALRILPRAEAERIFLYNLALRFGAHRKAVADGTHVYGLVPYLLFCVLNDLGFLTVEHGRLRLASLMPTDLCTAMAAAAAHAEQHFTAPELTGMSLTDLAIHVATYVRRRLDDAERRTMFKCLEGEHG
jgi:hypothetical protein